MHQSDPDPEAPLDSLARARAQSRELAEARAERLGALRLPSPGRSPERRGGAPWRPRMAFGFALLLILGTGAFALAKRALRPVVRAEPASSGASAGRPRDATTAALPARVSPARSEAPATPLAAAPTSRPARRRPVPPATPPAPAPAAPTSEAPPRTVDELLRPDDEPIVVRRRNVMPPLFDPEEWKQQHAPASR